MFKPEHLEILENIKEMEASGDLDRARFSDIPIEVYHHPDCPGISSSQIKLILERSFAHYKAKVETYALRFGNVFHTYTNEPDTFADTYEIAPTSSKRSKEWFSAQRKNAGQKILITIDEFYLAKFMSNKVFDHPEAGPLLQGATFEETFFSRDEETGILKKCRVDARKGLVLSDLKSTENASARAFRSDAIRYGYGISAAYYCEIVTEVLGQIVDDFRLLACEKPSPHEVAVYKIHEGSLQDGEQKFREVLRTVAAIESGKQTWKGYPFNQTIII
jgi:hypothetical protein